MPVHAIHVAGDDSTPGTTIFAREGPRPNAFCEVNQPTSILRISRILSDTEAEALAKDLTVGEALEPQQTKTSKSIKLRWNKQNKQIPHCFCSSKTV